MKNKTSKSYDILGVSSATLCLIHCMVFPLLTIVPFGFSEHAWIDIFFISIGTFVVVKILLSDANFTVKCILTISLLLVIVSIAIELLFDYKTYLIFFGGVGMIYGHYLNYKHHSQKH